jgi:hypothetical protein
VGVNCGTEKQYTVDMLLTVYVDDLLLIGKKEDCDDVARQLMKSLDLVYLGSVKYLLGIEITRDITNKSLVYSQEAYTRSILQRFHMADCNSVATPEATDDIKIPTYVEGTPMPYREAVGALQYLVTCSRPDIAHAVRKLGEHLHDFQWEDFWKVKRVLRYLKGTVNYGLHMKASDSEILKLEAYTDADYANALDRKSVSGYVVMIDGNVISYASRKQSLNAQSTAESEYIAMNEGARELLWYKGLMDELKFKYQCLLVIIMQQLHYVRNLENIPEQSI